MTTQHKHILGIHTNFTENDRTKNGTVSVIHDTYCPESFFERDANDYL